jgi:hypothetical protein
MIHASARERRPLSLARIRKLIYVSGGYQMGVSYRLNTAGFDANAPIIRYSVYRHAADEAHWLRERAYERPWLFPFAALKLHEWAKIEAYRRAQLEQHHQQSLRSE